MTQSSMISRRGRWIGAVLVLSGGLLFISGAEPSGPAPHLQDVLLARAALAALDEVPDLRGINLVVSVVDGIAVIGGPVPSVVLAQRAEQVIRTVPGIRDVRNTCFVSSGPDPLLRAVADKSWQEQRRPSLEVPGVWGQPAAPVSPFPLHGSGVARHEDRSRTVIARRPSEALPGGKEVLGAPVGPPRSDSSPSSRDVPAVAPGTLTAASRDQPAVMAAAWQIQRSDSRFARLTIEWHEQTLWISGRASRPEDAWDLASRLRQLPGVQRVVVGSIQTP
ncbi:MAG: BON domain-containing protein [Gemmataceae bacterium]|nr:BON domain-containing protein [Gemmataceae bacterium]MCS7270086.1 BON domain-containing protein [Gemmataceae bacterium]MDW8243525.1 BON domain-containing protein [Thermogemmata sp.]